jgi:hypothetical protein
MKDPPARGGEESGTKAAPAVGAEWRRAGAFACRRQDQQFATSAPGNTKSGQAGR